MGINLKKKSGGACVVALVPEKIPLVCVKVAVKVLSEYHRNSRFSRRRRRRCIMVKLIASKMEDNINI